MSNSIVKFQKKSFGNSLNKAFKRSHQWVSKTPERALDKAYEAVLAIKAIEAQHFNGYKVCDTQGLYSPSVLDYFIREVDKHLNTVKVRLIEFKATQSLLPSPQPEVLEKLRVIDEVVTRYKYDLPPNQVLNNQTSRSSSTRAMKNQVSNPQSELSPLDFATVEKSERLIQGKKGGALPRSIGRTINKIKTELDDSSEERLMNSYRASRKKTKSAINFLLMLVLIPFLMQQLSKAFVFFPLVEKYRSTHEVALFLNREMKEEALHELKSYEEELQMSSLLYKTPPIEREILEQKMAEKAEELSKGFERKSSEAISNIFADFLGLFAFALVILFNQNGLAAFKSLLNSVIYDLSDSAKAFIIILATDMFVGFHSPHGWEVILEGIASHFGIAANHSLIFLFIATFPVILDTIMKYWIFRYLNQVSPSAVATLKNMNE